MGWPGGRKLSVGTLACQCLAQDAIREEQSTQRWTRSPYGITASFHQRRSGQALFRALEAPRRIGWLPRRTIAHATWVIFRPRIWVPGLLRNETARAFLWGITHPESLQTSIQVLSASALNKESGNIRRP